MFSNKVFTYLIITASFTVVISAVLLALSLNSSDIEANITSSLENSEQIGDEVSVLSAEITAAQSKVTSMKQKFKQRMLSACKSKQGAGDHCYWGVATAYNDSSICESVTTNSLKDSCFSLIATDKQDASLCEKVERKDNVITCRAAVTGSVSLCEKIDDTLSQTQCVNEVAKTQKDVGVCTNLPNDNDYNRRICLTKAAVENTDPALCEQICENPSPTETNSDAATCETAKDAWRDSCFMKVGIVSSTESVCEKVYASDKRNYCLGLVKEDISYCSNITSNESYAYNCDAILNSDETTDYKTLFGR
jgi:hypothetical protein